MPFIIIFGTLSFRVSSHVDMNARAADHNQQPKSFDLLTSRSVNAGDTVSSDVGDDSCGRFVSDARTDTQTDRQTDRLDDATESRILSSCRSSGAGGKMLARGLSTVPTLPRRPRRRHGCSGLHALWYDTIRYDTIRDAILTCARKPT